MSISQRRIIHGMFLNSFMCVSPLVYTRSTSMQMPAGSRRRFESPRTRAPADCELSSLRFECWEQTWVLCKNGSCPNHGAILPAPGILLLFVYLHFCYLKCRSRTQGLIYLAAFFYLLPTQNEFLFCFDFDLGFAYVG